MLGNVQVFLLHVGQKRYLLMAFLMRIIKEYSVGRVQSPATTFSGGEVITMRSWTGQSTTPRKRSSRFIGSSLLKQIEKVQRSHISNEQGDTWIIEAKMDISRILIIPWRFDVAVKL